MKCEGRRVKFERNKAETINAGCFIFNAEGNWGKEAGILFRWRAPLRRRRLRVAETRTIGAAVYRPLPGVDGA